MTASRQPRTARSHDARGSSPGRRDFPVRAPGRSGLLRYVLAWAVGAAAILAGALAFLDDGGSDDAVTLPPVRQIELTAAARAAGCELRRGDDWDVLELPLPGGRGVRPAPAGVYERAPEPSALVAALRRGLIVILHRRDLADEVIEDLRALQDAVPAGTIVTPEPVRTRYAVAVAGWRALVGCRRYSSAAVDAIRLFRGRYVGLGPDRPTR